MKELLKGLKDKRPSNSHAAGKKAGRGGAWARGPARVRKSSVRARQSVSSSGLGLEPGADPETAERIRKQPRGPGRGEHRHQGVLEPAVCAEAMAAAVPAAAGEDGRRRRPGAGK